MASNGKAPVFEIIREGVVFARAHFAVYLPAAATVAAVTALLRALARLEGLRGLGEAALAVGAIMAELAFATFVLRLALRQDRGGFLGLKFGEDESRVFLVLVATLAIGALFGIVGMFALSFAVTMAAQRSGVDLEAIANDQEALAQVVSAQFAGPGAPLLWAIAAMTLFAVAWIGARLAVAPAATVGEKRTLILATFPWTRGNALRIIAALAPFQILSAFPIVAAAGVDGPLPVVLLTSLVMNFVQLSFITPALLGATAYLYKGFRPPDFR